MGRQKAIPSYVLFKWRNNIYSKKETIEENNTKIKYTDGCINKLLYYRTKSVSHVKQSIRDFT